MEVKFCKSTKNSLIRCAVNAETKKPIAFYGFADEFAEIGLLKVSDGFTADHELVVVWRTGKVDIGFQHLLAVKNYISAVAHCYADD